MDHVGSIEEKNWMSKLDSPFMKHLPELRTLNVTIKTKHVLNFLHAFCIEVLKGIENKNRKYTLVELLCSICSYRTPFPQ